MKSVGEVMAVGRTFEESLQKAIRMLDIGNDGLVLNRVNGKKYTEEEIEYKLSHHDDQILYNVAIALKMGIAVDRIYKLSAIDPWFIEKIQNIVNTEAKLQESELDESMMWEAKKMGFSDKQIARSKEKEPDEIREIRTPFLKPAM
jgi:carbamoyl-phosphate synthase large subunit